MRQQSCFYTAAQPVTTVFYMAQRRLQLGTSVVLASVIYLITAACAFTNTKVVDNVLVDTPRGSVFLQTAEDGWFKTAHPLSLSPAFLSSVFHGVYLKTAKTGRDDGDQVFSDGEAKFLSTTMSAALAKAASRQVIGFRVRRETETGAETTAGILYVQGRLLHLTFTHYRAREGLSNQPDISHQLIPNSTGSDMGQLSFDPDSVRRSSRHEQPDVTKTPPIASVVLDYQALPFWRVVPTDGDETTHSTPSTLHGTSDGTEEARREEETELESLREEVRSLRRRLLEIDLHLQHSKTP